MEIKRYSYIEKPIPAFNRVKHEYSNIKEALNQKPKKLPLPSDIEQFKDAGNILPAVEPVVFTSDWLRTRMV